MFILVLIFSGFTGFEYKVTEYKTSWACAVALEAAVEWDEEHRNGGNLVSAKCIPKRGR